MGVECRGIGRRGAVEDWGCQVEEVGWKRGVYRGWEQVICGVCGRQLIG